VEAKRGRDFIDPNRGKLSGSKILMDEELENAARRYTPQPRKSRNMMDPGIPGRSSK
jgi:hypothetical protein